MLRISAAGLTILGLTLLTGMTQQPKAEPADELHPSGGGHPNVPMPAENWPQAKAEDVASIDAIMAAFYDSTAGPAKTPRNWERFKSLFQPEARLIAARARGDGSVGAFFLSPDQYIEANRRYLDKGGFFEREAGRRTETFGNIAHIWSTFESRRDKDAPAPYARGIYSIQLLKDGNRWWIVSVYWDHEREDNKIPDRYLTTPKE